MLEPRIGHQLTDAIEARTAVWPKGRMAVDAQERMPPHTRDATEQKSSNSSPAAGTSRRAGDTRMAPGVARLGCLRVYTGSQYTN